jgi:hypothetical protein
MAFGDGFGGEEMGTAFHDDVPVDKPVWRQKKCLKDATALLCQPDQSGLAHIPSANLHQFG